MTATVHPLYQAALDADSEFMSAPAKQFPNTRHGDVRYQTSRHNDATRVAAAAMQAATKRWLDYMRAQA